MAQQLHVEVSPVQIALGLQAKVDVAVAIMDTTARPQAVLIIFFMSDTDVFAYQLPFTQPHRLTVDWNGHHPTVIVHDPQADVALGQQEWNSKPSLAQQLHVEVSPVHFASGLQARVDVAVAIMDTTARPQAILIMFIFFMFDMHVFICLAHSHTVVGSTGMATTQQ